MTEYKKALLDHSWIIDEYWSYIGSSVQLPTYGWKLHVSFDYQYAEEAAKVISWICENCNLHGKIISSLDILAALNSGAQVSSRQVGKAATIYFPTVERLIECLPLISSSLTYHGPPIITDRRVKNSSCLSVRYGLLKMESLDDISEPSPPDSDSKKLINLIEESEPKFPIQFSKIKLLKHSAKGISYFAFDCASRKEVFVKSGFKYGRLSADGEYGSDMIRKEEASFLDVELPGIVHTPKVIRSFEDDYLYVSVRERIKGPNLYELRENGSTELLNHVASKIISSLTLWYDHNESNGVRVYDLSPANFVLDSEFNLFFVDAEYVLSDKDEPPEVITLFEQPRDLSMELSDPKNCERYFYEKSRLIKYVECWAA